MKAYRGSDAQIDLESSEWLARLVNDTPRGAAAEREAEFAAWLRRSPRHVRAFLDASDAFYRLDGLTPQLGAEVRQLIGLGAKVTAFPGSAVNAPIASRLGRRGVLAAAVALLALGTASLAWWIRSAAEYATAVGEQRMVKLDDGSIVHLNTHSQLRVRFSSSLREITLQEGEAFFSVERDVRRPFVVRSGDATVRAIGTAFNVYRHGPDVQVAVVEGKVQVSSDAVGYPRMATPAAQPQPVMLAAGEEVNVVSGQVSKARLAAVSDALAWRERRLVFKDTPLADVAAEFNRYNRSQMRIEDEALQAKPLTGIFSADHPQSLILYLSEFKSLTVAREGQDWVVRSR